MSTILGLLPAGYIFQPIELRAMGEAFDNTLAMRPAADRDLVAAAIFETAQSGELDPQKLCEAALRTSATPEELRYLRSM